MEKLIPPQEIERLMDLPGKVRGVAFKTEEGFVLEQEGKEGVERLEEALAEMGHPLKFDEVRPMDFYPLGMIGLTQLTIKKLFDYDDEKIKELGKSEAKVSLIIRLFMKYFVSTQRIAKEVPKMWRRYYSIGDLEIAEMNDEEKRAVLRLKDFKVSPVHCLNLIGYFASVLQMVVNSPVECRETKCVFKGDDCHEFTLTWK
ncbi:MAG: hypothetical protein GF370_02945 [Candidatus Nealsonbacteria bacterium]|nr:hypothetical protein [Candidatus Nealsonbacteria bacterium]